MSTSINGSGDVLTLSAASMAAAVYQPAGSNAVATTVQGKLRESVSVFDFMTASEIANVQAGTGDVTAALQKAFDALTSYQIRSLYFPPGDYLISDTITPPSPLMAAQFIGASGYDGTRGPINDGLRTRLKWIGATDATKPMVKFDRADGVLWRGISLNCNYKAGYGLQFMSSVTTSGSIKNIVENCSIHYALRDGVIVGEDGNPTAAPGDRQFFGNVFRNLTMYGCARAAVHINEWNADQQMLDTVMVYLDDAPSPQDTLNAFWFDHGGQQSVLLNCQSGGMTVDPGIASSGFAIKNKADDASPYSTTAGAFGLTVIGFWQEGGGGLYYGITGTNDEKAFLFENCRSFTSDTANRSVYIDKGTSDQVPYTFISCTFLSDIEIASSTFNRESLSLLNCLSPSRFLIDDAGTQIPLNTQFATQVGITGGGFTIPRFATTMQVTLDSNAGNGVFAPGLTSTGQDITLIVTQDGTGSRTITWGATGVFLSTPAIPQPSVAPGAKSVYTFVSNGANYVLKTFQSSLGPAFSAYQSVSQSIPSTTWTRVQLQSEEFDTNNAFDSTTNYRFQPSEAGYYQANCGIAVSTAQSRVICAIYKNGSAYKIGSIPSGDTLFGNTTSALVYLNGSTDYIEFYTYFSIGQGASAVATDTYFQASLARGV